MIIKEKNLPKEFKKVKIEITFESKDEMRELWHRLNLSVADLKRSIHDNDCASVDVPNKLAATDTFWEFIDDCMTKYDLKKD